VAFGKKLLETGEFFWLSLFGLIIFATALETKHAASSNINPRLTAWRIKGVIEVTPEWSGSSVG